ncbi:MAG: DNA-primase RepB domain-containing protein [Bryobacteraceae bacterium]
MDESWGVLGKAESTAAARVLAERWGGDMSSADWRHFGRLAGFTNRKPKHVRADGQFPFVRIVEAESGRVLDRSGAVLEHARASMNARLRSAEEPKPRVERGASNGRLKTIGDFRVDPRYDGDGNRTDLAYALYARSHGANEEDIRAQINTRDLSKKGGSARQQKYIERTVAKATCRQAARVR